MKKLNFLSVLLLFITVFFAQNLSGQTYFSESFEGVWSGTPGTAPSGWYNIHTAGGATQKYWAKNTWSGSAWSNTSYNAPPTTPTGAYDLSSVAWYNDYNASATQKDQLTTNNIDLSAANTPRVTFYLAINSLSSLTLKLRGSNDGGVTWADIQTITKPGTAWTKVTVAIPAIYKVSNARFGLEVTATLGNYDVWADKFVIEETPVGPMNGAYTINNTLPTTSPMVNDGTANFNSFTSAINYLNEVGITGSVIFNVASGLTFTEDCPAITATGTSSNSITFQKSGSSANPVIKPTGTSATTDAGIKIAGGDYITFDGIDITIATGSLVEYGYYLFGTLATNGAQNNTIKNSSIALNKANTSSIGIYSNANLFTLSNASGANSNNKFYNLSISNVYAGMYLYGYSSTYPDLSSEIGITGSGTATIIGGATANDIGNGTSTTYGIKTNYQSGIKIFNTEVRNVKCLSTAEVSGIWLANTYGTNNIYNNKIHDIGTNWTTTASLVYGLKLDIASGNTANVYNNTVNSLTHGSLASASSTQIVFGIAALTGSGTSNFYNNSVRIDLTDANSSSTAFYGSLATYTTKNNIFANYSTAGVTSKRYAYYSSSGTIAESNNNILYINQSGINNFTGYRFADYKSLAQFAAAISTTAPSNGAEAGSSEANPTFNTNELTFSANNPAKYSGSTIASPAITTDIAGNTRDINRPTIGAYEDLTYSLADNSAPVLSNVTITGSGTTSTTISVALNDNSNSANNAIVRLWYRIGTSGAYTGIDADSKPSGSMNGTYAWSTSLPIGQYNFYITARDDQGAGTGIWANPIWSNSFAGFNVADPPNLIANPDAAANVRSFSKLKNLAGGTYDVGSTSTLVNLTAVANELNNSTLQGNVVYELTSNYDGTTGETFPITFNQFATDGLGSWTVTIRVKSGAGARTTSGSGASNYLIRFNGTDNIIIDGRENGEGSANSWTISNSSTTSPTLFFVNDAKSNTIRYCNIKSAGDIVGFATTTETDGNDNNTIAYCNIGGIVGANYPKSAIYSIGTSSKENSGNIVSNNNIFDCRAAAYGIQLGANNTDWTITGNSFYQTTAYSGTASTTAYGIYINSGSNHILTGNYIGGGAANCGGTAWTINGAATTYRFTGIYLSVGTLTASSVQNNKISNFDWLTSSGTTTGAGSFCGINIAAGNVNVGNISGNIIGNSSVDNIKLTATNAALLVGINSSSTGSVNISNNSIYGLTSVGNTASIGAYLTGIQTSGTLGNYTIQNNMIGSTTIANSMRAGISGTSTGATYVKGIDNSATGTISISQDTIANMASFGTNTSSIIRGIVSTAGTNSITLNIIRDINTSSSNSSTTTSSSLIGISQTSTNSGQSVAQNTISALSNSHATAAVVVAGIYHVCNNTVAEVISRNSIYNLEASNATAAIYGIYSGGSSSVASNVKNNMIRLGYKKDGSDLTFGCFMAGIYDAQGIHNYYHNSIYIGGANVVGSSLNTYAFISSITSGARSFQNNIFVNHRSNLSTGGKHFAVRVAGTGVNPSGLNMNYNIYNVSGTGSVFGYYGADITTLATWKSATGQDANSADANPNFVNADSVVPDLHILSPSPVEAAGINIVSVIDDFDGETRGSLSPTDIGADAGNFSTADFFAPIIAFNQLGNGITEPARILANFAGITDNVGVSDGAKAPRLYYKKSSDADVFAGNTAADNGWKYVSALNNLSPYSFTIEYSKLFGNGVTGGDTIQYFLVAQDEANNFASLPVNASYNGNPPVQNIVAKPANPYFYIITQAFQGTYNVGNGHLYTSLTGNNGFFDALNKGVVTDNINVNITSNLNETGNVALNQLSENGLGGFYITIQPNDTINRLISGSYNGGLIRFNGADRIIVDGSFNGIGKFLTISNTYTTNANSAISVLINNNSSNIKIKNTNVYSKYRSISISQSDSTLIEANNIYGDKNGNSNYYQAGIYISNAATNTKILRNLIHDFYYTGTGGYPCYGIYYNSNASSVTEISNNAIYAIKAGGDNYSTAYNPAAIYISSGGNMKISNNSIYLTGNVLGRSYSAYSAGILINSGISLLDIRNNNIQNAMNKYSTSSYTSKTYAIYSLSANNAFSFIDFNNYYLNGVNPNIGYISGDKSSLSLWKSATLKDSNSYSQNPYYFSNENLKPTSGNYLNATYLNWILTDIELNIRNVNQPSVGAYEAPITISKALNLIVFLEGLFDVSTEEMRPVQNESGNQYGQAIADQITVELHNAITPSIIEYSFTNKNLYVNGNCSIDLNQSVNSSYYIVVKHRNSIAIWSNLPVSFSNQVINYSFTENVNFTYGGNSKEVLQGVFAMYVGDVNQDGLVDGSDMSDTEFENNNFATGYVVTDVNGDGLVDGSDMSIVESANNSFVSEITP